MLATVALLAGNATSATAATSQSGARLVVASTQLPVTGVQGSSVPFVVSLPSLAACSRSTSSSGYHVQSFLVDASLGPDPSSYRYQASGPTVGLPLWTGLSPYANTNTNIDATIPAPPAFSWRHFFRLYLPGGQSGVGRLHAGTWHLGISCSDANNATDRFWDTPIRITDSSSDPHGFVWQPLSATTSGEVGGGTTPVGSGGTPGLPAGYPGAQGNLASPAASAPGVNVTGLPRTGWTSHLLWLAAALLVAGGVLVELTRDRPRPMRRDGAFERRRR